MRQPHKMSQFVRCRDAAQDSERRASEERKRRHIRGEEVQLRGSGDTNAQTHEKRGREEERKRGREEERQRGRANKKKRGSEEERNRGTEKETKSGTEGEKKQGREKERERGRKGG